MFLTRPSFAEWMPPFEGFENCKAWGAIEIPAALPWFVLHIEARNHTQESFTVSYLLSSFNNVKNLLSSLKQDDSILGVHAAFPPGYTGQRTWQMAELQEIWEASFRDHGELHVVGLFKTAAGETLLDPPICGKPKKLHQKSLLFKRIDP